MGHIILARTGIGVIEGGPVGVLAVGKVVVHEEAVGPQVLGIIPPCDGVAGSPVVPDPVGTGGQGTGVGGVFQPFIRGDIIKDRNRQGAALVLGVAHRQPAGGGMHDRVVHPLEGDRAEPGRCAGRQLGERAIGDEAQGVGAAGDLVGSHQPDHTAGHEIRPVDGRGARVRVAVTEAAAAVPGNRTGVHQPGHAPAAGASGPHREELAGVDACAQPLPAVHRLVRHAR